jgi:hypothetical protein
LKTIKSTELILKSFKKYSSPETIPLILVLKDEKSPYSWRTEGVTYFWEMVGAPVGQKEPLLQEKGKGPTPGKG